ncbi:MAG: hypothetical protein AAGD33_09605 [Actinomycetota bacterium]
MTAGDLVVVLSALLLTIGFAALIVVLLRVLDAVRDLRVEVADLRNETRPLIAELRESTDEARHDLERFDRVLGSAEAIGDAVGERVTKTAFSSPAIKAAGFARGAKRTWTRLRGSSDGAGDLAEVRSVIDVGSRGDRGDRARQVRRRA